MLVQTNKTFTSESFLSHDQREMRCFCLQEDPCFESLKSLNLAAANPIISPQLPRLQLEFVEAPFHLRKVCLCEAPGDDPQHKNLPEVCLG